MKTMHRFWAAAAVIAGSVGLALPAKAQSNGLGAPSMTMQDFSGPQLRAVLATQNLALEPGPKPNSFALRAADGRVLVLDPNCHPDIGCVGLSLLAFINTPADTAKMARFNTQHLSVRASGTSDGKVVLNRYLIGDFGYDGRNFLIDAAVTLNALDAWISLDETPSIGVSAADGTHEQPAAQGFKAMAVSGEFLNDRD